MQRNEIIPEEEDAEEAFVKAPAGKVFLGANNYLEPYKREYFISEKSFFNIMYGFAISKLFCCKHYLNRMIHRLFAAGVFQKLNRDEHSQMELKLKPSEKNAPDYHNILQIQDLKEAFIIWISGYILSFITFLIEITLKHYVHR